VDSIMKSSVDLLRQLSGKCLNCLILCDLCSQALRCMEANHWNNKDSTNTNWAQVTQQLFHMFPLQSVGDGIDINSEEKEKEEELISQLNIELIKTCVHMIDFLISNKEFHWLNWLIKALHRMQSEKKHSIMSNKTFATILQIIAPLLGKLHSTQSRLLVREMKKIIS